MYYKNLATKSVAVGLVLAAGFAAATVSNAEAKAVGQAIVNTVAGNPTPKCPSGYTFNKQTGKCDKVSVTPSCGQGFKYDQKSKKCVATGSGQICKTEGNVITCVANPFVTIGPKKVSASDMASGRIWIGSDVRLKGTQYKSPKCYWTKGGFTNSMMVDGQLKYYWDSVPGKLCPNKNSPTGWVKVAGGTTGRLCDNPAKAGTMPGLLKGTIINVRSTVNVWLPLNAKVSVVIDDRANGCYASASASALARIRLNVFIRARGNVDVNIFADMFAKLETRASASTDCKPGPTTTVTVPGTTTVVTTPGPTTTTTTTPGPTTTTTTTPANQPPSLANQTQPEEVFNNGETYPNICVTVSAKNGNSINVIFGATYGSFMASTRTLTSSGVDRVCTTYIAPRDSSAAGRNEQITYDAHDNTTGLNAQRVVSQPFPIKSPPARP